MELFVLKTLVFNMPAVVYITPITASPLGLCWCHTFKCPFLNHNLLSETSWMGWWGGYFCKKGYLLRWFVPAGNVMQWRPVWSIWLTHLGLIWVPIGIYSQLTLNRIGSYRVFLIHRLHQILRPCSTMHVHAILLQRLGEVEFVGLDLGH